MPFSAKALTRRSVVSCACAAAPIDAIARAARVRAASLLIAFMRALSWSKVKRPPMLAPAAGLGPALGADQRHEHDGAEIGLAEDIAFALDQDEALRVVAAVDRHDEAAALG